VIELAGGLEFLPPDGHPGSEGEFAVVDHGRVIADGTAAQLKAKIGGERVQLTVASPSDLTVASEVLARLADGPPLIDQVGRTVEAAVASAARCLTGSANQRPPASGGRSRTPRSLPAGAWRGSPASPSN